jgi:hypothetical protein
VQQLSVGAERTPLSVSGSTSLLVAVSAGEVPFGVEVVVDLPVDCGELLK